MGAIDPLEALTYDPIWRFNQTCWTGVHKFHEASLSDWLFFFGRASLWIHVRITFLRGEFFIKISVFSFAEYWCGTQWTWWYWTLQVGKSWIGDTAKSKKLSLSLLSLRYLWAFYLFSWHEEWNKDYRCKCRGHICTYTQVYIDYIIYMFLGNVYSCLYSLLILIHLFVPWLSFVQKQGSMSFNPFRDFPDCDLPGPASPINSTSSLLGSSWALPLLKSSVPSGLCSWWCAGRGTFESFFFLFQSE